MCGIFWCGCQALVRPYCGLWRSATAGRMCLVLLTLQGVNEAVAVCRIRWYSVARMRSALQACPTGPPSLQTNQSSARWGLCRSNAAHTLHTYTLLPSMTDSRFMYVGLMRGHTAHDSRCMRQASPSRKPCLFVMTSVFFHARFFGLFYGDGRVVTKIR